MSMNAEVLTVGNELLNGHTTNTNATHIARRLTSMGFVVRRITAVMDEVEEIASVVKEVLARSPALLVVSGGLGPTYDDRTAEGIALGLGRGLVENSDALDQIRSKYGEIEVTPARRKMAFMPEGAVPVPNDAGVAPGIYLRIGHTEILATPGVPREMESVLENFLNRYLVKRPSVVYAERSFKARGIMESVLAPHVISRVKKYNLYIKTHPKGREVGDPYLEVQIAGSSPDREELLNRLESCEKELREIVAKMGGIVE
ncbi:competence protein ComA [Sulfodiicoccus acidiphilus]|uniref:Competence protein ComA n=1 Tax=Sulfodiicoccus acidiphilus TaxID=1670455 RepID=A0A348B6U3_9CREN|nr:nicotinamide mononucleotide deamidase-related protein [Sulfodiicoccus acidiphilus]BBD73895.1 competence protein ComA [Sulfodiicoccus acidiphilus]GGT96033.1 competence protein ComA [Sulfodiicoccus acidiphilus]